MKFSEQFKIADRNISFLDINLYGDYPFFIDPLLLDNNEELPNAYNKFLNYFTDSSSSFVFKEIKNTHLGFGYLSNSGHGIGKNIGKKLKENSLMQMYGFDLDTIDIFIDGVGVDLISDMTTNIILEDLCDFTRGICSKYDIPTVDFALDNGSIKPIRSKLPIFEGECIILVPKSILRKNKLLLSKSNFVDNIYDVVETVENGATRARLNDMLYKTVFVKTRNMNEIKKIPKKEIGKLINKLVSIEPQLIPNFKNYMRFIDGNTNITNSDLLIEYESTEAILHLVSIFKKELLKGKEEISCVDSVRNLLIHYKHELEHSDLVSTFSIKEMQDEKQHQRIFRTISKAVNIGVNAEVNNGNGPVDFKFVSNGESILTEFKLARATNASNIYKQLEKYFEMNKDAVRAFAVLISYNDEQLEKSQKIEASNTNPQIETIIINCNPQNYKSASKK
ncbi:MAG: hypothetical protein ACK5NF_05570 [Bacilli bacterium]